MRYLRWSFSFRAAIAGSILLLGACDGSPYGPVAGTPPISQLPPPEPPGQVPAFPAVSGPAQIFMGQDTARISSTWLRVSRYVLRNDGTFQLQSVNSPSGFAAWPGTYEREGAHLIFRFTGIGAYSGSEYVPGEATGRLNGSELSVEYNIVMVLSDFEDELFVLERADF